ncbi:hypothetical protein [Leptolyngbya sp. CCY15150]|uniref:hypothetical protein n=1 Tax=Leptolyngbya sp. CCY15150 TaxID=2767772 RepID=UPI00194E0CF9|nr:hypothetical protein [Leptolyngbya sp. CCY15150]
MKFKMMSLALIATLATTVGACAAGEETTPAPETTEEAAPEAEEEAMDEEMEEGAEEGAEEAAPAQ